VDGLTDEQLATPSLCGTWTVHDVAGHLILPLTISAPAILRTMLIRRTGFDGANDVLSRKLGERPSREIAATLRQRATSTVTPPTHGPTAPLTDILVHGQDVRRPLGIEREFEPHRLRTALDFLASPKAKLGFVPPKRIAGLRFQATDLDWSAGGGQTVEGTGEALLMAYTGRPDALKDLTGDGVPVLAGRLRR
jgi:uncharacterized protein (TIGR03083 family)